MSEILAKVLEEAQTVRAIDHPDGMVLQVVRKDGMSFTYNNCEIEVEEVYERGSEGYTSVLIKVNHRYY